jgi:hypothetical protein
MVYLNILFRNFIIFSGIGNEIFWSEYLTFVLVGAQALNSLFLNFLKLIVLDFEYIGIVNLVRIIPPHKKGLFLPTHRNKIFLILAKGKGGN